MSFSLEAESYDAISRWLHWLMALFVLVMLASGLSFEYLGAAKQNLLPWHKFFGLLVLVLVLFRMIWRLMHGLPAGGTGVLQKLAAVTHRLLYVLMVLLPLTGWAMVNAFGQTSSLPGGIFLPVILNKDRELAVLFKQWHGWLAYGLLGLVALHIGAALYHHFICRDNLLKRMLG